MPLQGKRRVAQVHHLCINCLYSGHDVDQCRSNIVCTVNNCNARHNVLLHGDDVVANTIRIASVSVSVVVSCISP